MTFQEKGRLQKGLSYHEGCLEFRLNQIREAMERGEDTENLEVLVKLEEDKITTIKISLGIN